MRKKIIVLLILGVASISGLMVWRMADGLGDFRTSSRIVSIEEYVPERYDSLDEKVVMNGPILPEDYRRCISRTSRLHFLRMVYWSGNFKVQALVGVPKNFSPARKYPVQIFNRGGNRALGYLTVCNLGLLEDLAGTLGDSLVLASQYRGSPGSEGNDEFGGADVEDVIALDGVAESWPFADSRNMFLSGWSRGGMMTLLALKRGLHFNAAAVIAGDSDLEATAASRPEMAALFEELIPGVAANRMAALAERSAIQWPGKIASPLLLVHGGRDDRVAANQSKRLAEQLRLLHKAVRLVLFEGEGHGLEHSYPEMLSAVRSWFQEHSL